MELLHLACVPLLGYRPKLGHPKAGSTSHVNHALKDKLKSGNPAIALIFTGVELNSMARQMTAPCGER
jgi:hypothetical protein